MKNENGLVIAGINSLMYCWGMLYINVLFVEESHRGQQLGSLFLDKVEVEAKSMGASLSHLDTFDWQVKDFYLKAGYKIFGILLEFVSTSSPSGGNVKTKNGGIFNPLMHKDFL